MSTQAANAKSWGSGRYVRILTTGLAGILLIRCLACGAWWFARYISERKRTRWKSVALEQLARLSISSDEGRQELHELRTSRTNSTQPDWTREHVLLMTNGDYIFYEYRHGANIYFPPHLFLGRCSDGRWLYSSYHFCNSMAMVRSNEPPGSIVEFAKRYSAREFDGKSDDCLKMTE
jgi:hypothetical protein